MFCLSSPPLALKGQLKLTTTTTSTILLVFFLFTLYITSCEARHLRANSKGSSNKYTLTSKDKAAEVGDTEKQIRTASMVHGTGKTGVIAGSTIDQSMSTGATLINGSGGIPSTTHSTRVSQQLPHRDHEDGQGIHLDYAQPRSRTPYHN
ncbi:hypothetical protein BRADI_3g50917v3 [Brachypodium distachyon]|uniref:Uncharacterized protein n=1 Tax=Brachypodium distachyon TaxID=15368 RepID=I1ICC2_BRADI|nr:hypothetical protein BRADI_3g50917v3 [Brachypodium distachyon]